MPELNKITVKKKKQPEDKLGALEGKLSSALQQSIIDKTSDRLGEYISGRIESSVKPQIGNIAVPGPEGSLLTGSGESMPGYGANLEGVIKNIPKEKSSERTFLGNALSAFGKGATGTPINMGEEGRGWESNLAANVGAKIGTGLINAALFGGQAGTQAGMAATPTLYNTPEQQWKLGQTLQQWEAKRKYMLNSSPSLLTQQSKAQNMKNQALQLLRQGKVWNKAFGRAQDVTSAEEARQYLAGLAFENPTFNPNDPEIEATLQQMFPEEGSDPLGLLE